MSKVHNFSAGPAILPQAAIDASVEALKNFAGTGLSLIEVSHRSKEYEAVVDEATQLVKDILKLNDDYAVVFLQGGASLQFDMIPMNWLGDNQTAAYVNTGVWASRAIKEAKMFGKVNVLASSEDKNFSYIPKDYSIPTDAAYYHCTSNNTIYGTEMFSFPDTHGVPLVCDMSSDIFSRPFDANKFDMIYAGAQKNMGPAGTTLVILKKSFLEKRAARTIPTMLDYKVHIDNGSMYNTPSVFAIFVCMHTLRWIKSIGLEAMEARNKAKADTLYAEIDRNPLFVGTVAKEDRSRMNVNFVLNDKSMEDEFLKFCKDKNLSGLKGHRSVGGLRASLYNALELESVQALVDAMQDFETKVAGR
ncbi:MAG: 3-phosphoserine/phosphohydroxythreonine transaminase [Bacteroidia bacterium]|nr:3-phosphoserine/phosphohydroxythreonine transaminase [Bacteroidia bacterium]MBP7261168.1 3-phosphoserine/phosphohydroxythreonine transaminase [Bacteroidia bacterium]MBP9180046.1 3-phosphoserine/phosphohydroxythreonine transaminase [Bacteroidia bacterium]MBP9725226.1 3-phosphoserine/phosphohydroxythreonine transaminase [Bacteroidia bacterium]